MSVPPDDSAEHGDGTEAPLDFDPYRFGKPDYPIPPEFAPPGYVPPPVTAPPPVGPAYGQPQYGAPPAYGAPPNYGPPTGPAYGGGAVPPGYPPTGPGGYPPVPPQFHPEYPPQKLSNGKATAALVLGSCSVLFCWTTIVIDGILVVLALIFGAMGRSVATRDPRFGGKSMALTGMILAAVGAVGAIIFTVVFVHIASDCSDFNSGTSAFNNCVNHHLHL